MAAREPGEVNASRGQPVEPRLDGGGCSQNGRLLPALDPSTVPVDGRDLEDLLRYVAGLGPELRFLEPDGGSEGDWSGLVPESEIERLAAFLRRPASFEAQQNPELFVPHRVLLLIFLRLFKGVQDEANRFGRRHLDFYYREILGLEPWPAQPDRVTVLFELEPDSAPARLEAGTALDAGERPSGAERIYTTERELVVSHAQVARLSSVFVDFRVTDLGSVLERVSESPDRAMELWRLALGDPQPGDPLPDYPVTADQHLRLDFGVLEGLARLVGFAAQHLFMELYDLRDLMALKLQRDHSDAEWNRINHFLGKAGVRRDPNFQPHWQHPKDFFANLRAAVGDLDFDGLPDVKNIYELYGHRKRPDAREFIVHHLYLSVDDFSTLMQVKVGIDRQWTRINTLLQDAGRRLRGELHPTRPEVITPEPPFRLPCLSPEDDPPGSEAVATDFDANLELALGRLDFSNVSGIPTIDAAIRDIDSYQGQILALESYFFRLAEEFAYVMEFFIAGGTDLTRRPIVERLLEGAHRQKIHAARVREIRRLPGWRAKLLFALGRAESSLDAAAALRELRVYIRSPADAEFLDRMTRLDWSTVSERERRRVDEILEAAESVRQHFQPPKAVKLDWLNLYPAADATTVAAPAGQGEGAWKTFGGVTAAASDCHLGWAFASPMLVLGSGERRVTLTLAFDPQDFDGDSLRAKLSAVGGGQSPLRIDVSTGEGWLEPSVTAITVRDPSDSPWTWGALAPGEIELALTWPEEAVAISRLPAGVAGGVDSPWPVLRLMLRSVQGGGEPRPHTLYPLLRDLRLTGLHLDVRVAGLTPESLLNGDGFLEADQPFEPFTGDPAVGSRLRIAHPELNLKSLQHLTFDLRWMGTPRDFATHYRNYPAHDQIRGDGFTVGVDLVDRGVRRPLSASTALFEDDPRAPHRMELPLGAGVAGDLGASVEDRYVEWRLAAPDFQHQVYPAVASQKAIELAAAIARHEPDIAAADYQVDPPYTPKIERLRLGYGASLRLMGGSFGEGSEGLFHLHPFGYRKLSSQAGSGSGETPGDPPGMPWLPSYDSEGALYIGLRAVHAPETVTLLFELEAGSADSEEPPAPISWSYLSADRWQSLGDDRILRDGTRGLINSGILEIALEPALPSTLMPDGLYWLRATVSRHTASLCDTRSIRCQAVEAVLQGDEPAGRPLPAGSIEGLLEERPEIASIRQPEASRGGRDAESAVGFDVRVSERLRHRDRALQPWDYERLVLSHFPEVYRVRCLPVRLTGGDGVTFATPGDLKVVVLPEVRGLGPEESLEPRAPADLLASISELLSDRCPTFARLTVENACFVEVTVRLLVHFRDPARVERWVGELNEALRKFLSPWAYDEEADIEMGSRRIYANTLLDFVDRQPYVDFVETLKFLTSTDGSAPVVVPAPGDGGYFVAADRPDQVLISAQSHQIVPFFLGGDGEKPDAWPTGIGYMTVGLDFILEE